ncbi:MAG: AmmeMemoRadiSam system protein B [Labilithrix sp.]|nr:AmmeMemoRadiSam system protein B [Labilithrix sp.]MCW5813384.1 AmmeMemoRadiSam system protein B [Labilithrix sp.]
MIQDRRLGRALMLRDTQGVAHNHVVLPIDVVPIVARFTGHATCEQIARDLSKEAGETVPVSLVVQLASELEEALFVEGAPYKRERARIEREFADAAVRPASHAGGAYHDDPNKLADYIDQKCLSAAPASKKEKGRLVALVAPHIDPWRGAACYGAAYAAFAEALPADADTFILLGTSHAPMREPFALCRKAFATPLGRVDADLDAIDSIAAASDFDPYADQFNHKREHSLEFQAVFLRHVLARDPKRRPPRIVPILAGLGEQQGSGQSPSRSKPVARFLDAVRKVVDDKGAVVIAGADLAHVGPRFGDPRPLDAEERTLLDGTDRDSLDRAERVDAEAFWEHVAADLDTRRVCGLGPMYSLLRVIDPSAKGKVKHYEQTIDPEEGSIVSHAAVGFYL